MNFPDIVYKVVRSLLLYFILVAFMEVHFAVLPVIIVSDVEGNLLGFQVIC